MKPGDELSDQSTFRLYRCLQWGRAQEFNDSAKSAADALAVYAVLPAALAAVLYP